MRRASTLVVAGAALVVFGVAGPAAAGQIAIAVGAPERVAVGDEVEVKVLVTQDGDPVPGAEVALSYTAFLGGKEGFVVLDTATTEADGVALLHYQQRAADNATMRVSYEGPETVLVEPFEFTIAVDPGPQLHRSQAGVSIPWLSGWILIALATIVWGAIVYAASRLHLLGREEGEGPAVEGADPSGRVALGREEGSAPVATLLTLAALVTGIGMVIVLLRNPLTHANLDAPTGYGRTPVAYVGDGQPYRGPGLDPAYAVPTGDPVLDGYRRYVGYGCAGCHGLGGVGGVVGPELEADDFDEFARDVRRGPKGMPAYDDEVLDEEDLRAIYAYVEDRLAEGG